MAIETLERDIQQLNIRFNFVDAELKKLEMERATAQRKVTMLEQKREANRQKLDEAILDLEKLKRDYESINRDYYSIVNEMGVKGRELSRLKQLESINNVTRNRV